jgi:hypothetical protein
VSETGQNLCRNFSYTLSDKDLRCIGAIARPPERCTHALKLEAPGADKGGEATSQATAKAFSPALRAALTPVTGALFFLASFRCAELPRFVPAYQPVCLCTAAPQMRVVPKVGAARHR